MGSDWPVLSLVEAGITLVDCVHETPAAAEDGVPYIAIPQMSDGRIDTTGARLVAPEDVASWNRKANPTAHDVMLSRRCNPGETVFVPSGLECVVGQNLVLLRSDGQRVYPPFLRWLTRGPAWKEQVRRYLNVGAVFDSLKCVDIPQFRLPIPPLDVQRAVVAILGALDDKIELNRRMSRTLDEAAQAVFCSRFVETAGDPWPCGAGDLPSGWSRSRLDQQIVVERGLSYKGESLSVAGTGVPMYNLNSVSARDGLKSGGIKWYSGKYAERHTVQPGDVLVANTDLTQNLEVLGSPVQVPLTSRGRATFSHHLYRVRPRSESALTSAYVLGLLGERRFHAAVVGFANGTTVSMLPREALEAPIILVPPVDLVCSYDRMAVPILRRRESLESEAISLAGLRDSILAPLLSGRLSTASARMAWS